jgi:hypothetical protein
MTEEILLARINQARLLKIKEPIKKKLTRADRLMALIIENQQKLNKERTKKRKWYHRLFGKL